MAYIYKITNQLNNKCYIGKTEKLNPQERFAEHMRDAKKTAKSSRPLYSAFNKYGVENFKFEVLEETNNPTEREKYYIQYYNSYGKTGYNATRGGDGTQYLDKIQILEDYKNLQSLKLVAEKNNCHPTSIKNILDEANIMTVSSSEVMKQTYGKKVIMLDKITNEKLREFASLGEAAIWLIDNHYSNVAIHNAGGLRNKIKQVCENKRKTSCGFKWNFIE